MRIIQSTSFNGNKLLDGSSLASGLSLQAGYGSNGGILSGVGGAVGSGTVNSSVSTIHSIATAFDGDLKDLNGDGNLDLVTAGVGGVATVQLGSGGGSFGAAVTYSNSTVTNRIALHDVNNDGSLDLITSGINAGAGNVTIRLGNGAGSFGGAVSYTQETGYTADVTFGDVNNDGILDLVSAGGTGSMTVTIRHGNGDGTFGTALSYANLSGGSSAAYGLKVGDLNGDNILDLVTSGFDTLSIGTIVVRLGVGNGTFASAVSFAGGDYGLELGDLNGDNVLDIVSGGEGPSYGYIGVRLGTGNGTFSAQSTYNMGMTGVYAVALGDLNGDGNLDITGSGYLSGGRMGVILGTGTGTFGAAQSFNANTGTTYQSLIADINNDGAAEILSIGGGSRIFTFSQIVEDGVSALEAFSLKTIADARQALSRISITSTSLAKQRGVIGSFQSRIGSAISHTQSLADNYTIVSARIRDADIADEAAKLVSSQILQQAASAILAQANQQPALAIQLLSDV